MHTPSTRILSALAYDFGREYDPTDPVCQAGAYRSYDLPIVHDHFLRTPSAQ